ncbi:MAG: hypothetical protein ACRDOH_35825 [Streptosporangiaceae bacterium]
MPQGPERRRDRLAKAEGSWPGLRRGRLARGRLDVMVVSKAIGRLAVLAAGLRRRPGSEESEDIR